MGRLNRSGPDFVLGRPVASASVEPRIGGFAVRTPLLDGHFLEGNVIWKRASGAAERRSGAWDHPTGVSG